MNDLPQEQLIALLARWQAFSELQQRAFEFLAAEAIATGQEFEQSTLGATTVLTRMGAPATGQPSLQSETFQVVQRLQSADRSRQGLEQVASVLNTLRGQHAELLAATLGTANLPDPESMLDGWINALASTVSLADWRRRLIDALHGRVSQPMQDDTEDELF